MNCANDDLANCCGVCGIKVVAVMASHGRHEITRKACNALKSMGCEVVLVLTDGYDMKALQEFNPKQCTNIPLGYKWQFAVKEARALNPDYLLTCGSDDIISPDYLKNAIRIMKRGFEFVGVSQWYMENDVKLFKAWYSHHNDIPVGSGRLYSKKILDMIDWQLFNPKAERRLDDLGFQNIKRHPHFVSKDIDRDGLIITAVKGKWEQLNPIDKFFNVKTIGIKRVRNIGRL